MRVVPGGTVLVSGVRMTVLSGREGICGEQEAVGKSDKRYCKFKVSQLAAVNVQM